MRTVNLHLTPRVGFVELGAGASVQGGLFAYGQAGARLTQDLTVFAEARADRYEQRAVLGGRWTFGL